MKLGKLSFLLLSLSISISAQSENTRIRIAVLDFGQSEFARRVSGEIASLLSSDKGTRITDREQTRAAARGIGYAGSLNMSLREARDVGVAIGADYFLTGDAQIVRRYRSTTQFYFEGYASVFIVSARSGRLISWDRPSVEGASPADADKGLIAELRARAPRYVLAIRNALEAERSERVQSVERASAGTPVIEESPEDEEAASRAGVRLPHPYRRLRPAYPDSAARAEAEATVDVELELDEEGEVVRAEIVRWAGFGLDEATLNTVRQLHFRPATRDGVPIPMRVLLRYNFRKPAKVT